VAGVEDVSLRHDFDDQQVGVRLSPELMRSLTRSVADLASIEFVPRFLELVDLSSAEPVQVRKGRGFIAVGPPMETENGIAVGVYFYAGGRWSRWNRLELVNRDGAWTVVNFENLALS
jgi:hypothetical protein